MTEELAVVYTRDLSTGRIHMRIRQGDRYMTDERCNVDDAGAYEVVTADSWTDTDGEAFCGFCFRAES